MAMEFGKLNFAVGFNRTSAFPLDANSYFETYADAVAAAAGAAEVGSADSAYYIGQLIIVKDATEGVGLYQINAGKTLTKFGQASSADELAGKVSALETRCSKIEGKLILATSEEDGLMSKEDFDKLTNIEAGAQVNKIESVKLNGTALAITEKAVNIDLTDTLAPYEKTTDLTKKLAGKVDVVEGKGLSTNDYDAAAVAEVAKIKDKADASIVTALEGKVTTNTDAIATINSKLTGLTGAMHFIGTSTTDPVGESGATVEGHPTFEAGDVCLFGNKEYVYNKVTKTWVELGDEGSHATKDYVDTAKQAAIDAANAATDTKLEAYSNTAAVEGLIATAKTEAITEAGTVADGKITEALKSYTTTEALTTELGKKLDIETYNTDKEALQASIDGKVAQTAYDAQVAALEKSIADAQKAAQDAALVKSVAEGELAVSAEGELSVVAIAQDKVTGLVKALEDKLNSADLSNEVKNLTAKQVSSDLTINGKTYNGSAPVTVEKADLVAILGDLPAATKTATGVVKIGDGINVAEDGTISVPAAVAYSADETSITMSEDHKFSIKEVSTDLLKNGANELVLDGGTAQ